MSSHVPGFQSISLFFLHHFVLGKLASSSIGVNNASSSLAAIPVYYLKSCFPWFPFQVLMTDVPWLLDCCN